MFHLIRNRLLEDRLIHKTKNYALDFLLYAFPKGGKDRTRLANSASKKLESSAAAKLMIIAEAIRILHSNVESHQCEIFDSLWPKTFTRDQKIALLRTVYARKELNPYGLHKLLMWATRDKCTDFSNVDFEKPDWFQKAVRAPSYWTDSISALQYAGFPNEDQLTDFTFGQIVFGPARNGCRYVLPATSIYQLAEYAVTGGGLIPAELSLPLLFPGFSIDRIRTDNAQTEPVSVTNWAHAPGSNNSLSQPEVWQSIFVCTKKRE